MRYLISEEEYPISKCYVNIYLEFSLFGLSIEFVQKSLLLKNSKSPLKIGSYYPEWALIFFRLNSFQNTWSINAEGLRYFFPEHYNN